VASRAGRWLRASRAGRVVATLGMVGALLGAAHTASAAPGHAAEVGTAGGPAEPGAAAEDAEHSTLEALEAALERAAESDARRAELDRAIVAAQAELAATRAELAALADALARVRSRLVDARAAAADAVAAVAAADAELEQTTARLGETRDALADQEALFADQARQAYKYGSVSATTAQATLEALAAAETPADFTRSLLLVDSILSERVAVLDEHVELVEELRNLASEARRLQARRAAEQAAAAAARDQTSRLVARQEELVAEVAEREAEQEALLGALEVDRAAAETDAADAEAAAAELTAAVVDERRRALAGEADTAGQAFLCPVDGPHTFMNDWGFPRSGGRTHEGTDIFATEGTPIVAVADGTVLHVSREDRGLGGLTVTYEVEGFRLYNAHLASVADGIEAGVEVAAGAVLGTVGTTGNARGTPPHNHFGLYTPDGGAVNPFPLLAAACD
jgi:murein DD-endopeptidase MepM/ murein hydrolase activator NlpD